MSHHQDQDAGAKAKAWLQARLRAAMRAREAAQVRVLRALTAALDNAQAVPLTAEQLRYAAHAFGDGSAEVPRLALSADDVRRLFEAEAAKRRDGAAELARAGRPQEAAALADEAERIAAILAEL